MSKEISLPVRALADSLKAVGTVEAATGGKAKIVYEGAEDVFAKHLPESMTLDTIKAGQDALMLFATAHTLATGELGQAAMVKDKELASVSVKTKLGYGQIDTSYDRKREGTAMGKPWAKYGTANTDVIVGVGRKASDYKAVVAHLGEVAASVFAN